MTTESMTLVSSGYERISQLGDALVGLSRPAGLRQTGVLVDELLEGDSLTLGHVREVERLQLLASQGHVSLLLR
jgi:hypothetical protein